LLLADPQQQRKARSKREVIRETELRLPGRHAGMVTRRDGWNRRRRGPPIRRHTRHHKCRNPSTTPTETV